MSFDMSLYSNCSVCSITIDGSLKVHQIGTNYLICQSCRKIYYKIWREIFEVLFLKIFKHLNENYISKDILPVLPYSNIVADLDVSIIADMTCEIVKMEKFSNYCLNKIEFKVLNSYKSCTIKASNHAIQVRNESLKRKTQIKPVNPKFNRKCELCRFKFILFEIKEIPRIKLQFSELDNYELNLVTFLESLERANEKSTAKNSPKNNSLDRKDLFIRSRWLGSLYSKKLEFISSIIQKLKTFVSNKSNGDAANLTTSLQTVAYNFSGHYATDTPSAKKFKGEVNGTQNRSVQLSRPPSSSTTTEYISTSDMELYHENSATSVVIQQTLGEYSNFNHPGGYNSPYDVKMTIKNIFNIFNSFKKVLRGGFRMTKYSHNRQNFDPQELLPLKSFDGTGVSLQLVGWFFIRTPY